MLPDPREVPLISIDEAARIMHTGRSQTYAMAHRGELPVLKIGRSYKVITAKLLDMLGIDTAEVAS